MIIEKVFVSVFWLLNEKNIDFMIEVVNSLWLFIDVLFWFLMIGDGY